MSILQRRQSILGFLAGGLVGLLLIGSIGNRSWDSPAGAATQSALERKVDNLQSSLQTLQSRLKDSNARIAELEESLDEALTGTVKVGDADKLDGLDSTEFVLATEDLGERTALLELTVAGLVSGEIAAGDSLKLGGKAAADYALKTDLANEVSYGSGLNRSGDTVSIDFSVLDSQYLLKTGGTVGPLNVTGNVIVDGRIQPGASTETANAATTGSLRVSGGALQVSDGSSWRVISLE